MPGRENAFNDTYAMAPRQALNAIEAVGVQDAAKLVRDHAAAGLIRSYAQLQVTIEAGGDRHEVRGGKVLPSTWERIIAADVDHDVWSGGTARLAGSGLIGGTPAILVTGVAFHPDDIKRLANQQQPKPSVERVVSPESPTPGDEAGPPPMLTRVEKRQVLDLTALHSGALLLSVKQTMAALAIGRTKVYELIKEGKLDRPDGETRITAASVRRYAGLVS